MKIKERLTSILKDAFERDFGGWLHSTTGDCTALYEIIAIAYENGLDELATDFELQLQPFERQEFLNLYALTNKN